VLFFFVYSPKLIMSGPSDCGALVRKALIGNRKIAVYKSFFEENKGII